MKAAILVEQKKPLVVTDIEIPNELQYGQALVKIHYSGICGSQIGEIDGVKGPDLNLPHLLGHEAGGVVRECGPGVKKVKPGDHVILHWRKGDGIEAPTAKYQWNNIKANAGHITTLSEYSIISENRMTPIPKSMDLQVAALFGCAIPTAFGAVMNDAQLKIGESLVVIGTGGVGIPAILAGKLMGANPIIAVDTNEIKLLKAKEFGATHCLNAKKIDIRTYIGKILNDGADAVIETTGVREIRETAYEVTNKAGRTVLVGVPIKKGEKMSINSFELHFKKVITGSHGGDIDPTYHLPRFIDLFNSNGICLKSIITETFKLDNINYAIECIRRGDVVRCSIDMQ